MHNEVYNGIYTIMLLCCNGSDFVRRHWVVCAICYITVSSHQEVPPKSVTRNIQLMSICHALFGYCHSKTICQLHRSKVANKYAENISGLLHRTVLFLFVLQEDQLLLTKTKWCIHIAYVLHWQEIFMLHLYLMPTNMEFYNVAWITQWRSGYQAVKLWWQH